MLSIDTKIQMSAMRSLLGNVTPTLRSASIEVSETTIFWRCIYDNTATKDDLELAQIAGTEIIADFPSPWDIDEDIRIKPFPDSLDNLKHMIYLRLEPKTPLNQLA
ncbi:hypothetical protein [Rubritalea sp.]|uniref:hypothetical protein n=1 Tax=Rubritalea sp. TaxID=2109375 RepID=UPI003EF5E46B